MFVAAVVGVVVVVGGIVVAVVASVVVEFVVFVPAVVEPDIIHDKWTLDKKKTNIP